MWVIFGQNSPVTAQVFGRYKSILKWTSLSKKLWPFSSLLSSFNTHLFAPPSQPQLSDVSCISRRRRRRSFYAKMFDCWKRKPISQPQNMVPSDPPTSTLLSSSAMWALLPPDILDYILHHLPLPDRIRFAAVCSTWRSISRARPLFDSGPHPPWLLLIDELALTTATFFSLSEKRLYRIPQPDPPIFNRTWCGSSNGWLITMDVRSGLLLLNPITGHQIQLPPLTTLPNLVRPYRMAKVSWNSSSYTVMLALLSAPYLAFTREGDEAWISLEGTKRIADLAVHNGVFYTLDLDGMVGVWDLAGPSPLLMTVLGVPEWLPSKISYGYLVASEAGLLQVWRARDEMNFRVFELDFKREEWVVVESLGHQALFLDLFCSMSVSARDLGDLRANCIYFMTGHLEKPRREWGTRRFSLENRSVESIYPQSHCWETWVFSLDDRSIEPITHPRSHWKQPPIWITPNPI